MTAIKAHTVDPKRAKMLKLLPVAELQRSVLQQLYLTPVPKKPADADEHFETQPFEMLTLLPSADSTDFSHLKDRKSKLPSRKIVDQTSEFT